VTDGSPSDLNHPALARGFSSPDTMRLVPEGFLGGSSAGPEVEAGTALWLAGGPLAFSRVRLLLRAEVGAVAEVGFKLDELRSWADRTNSVTTLDVALARLTDPRPDILSAGHARPKIVGVLNVTPDSFSDGGQFENVEAAISHGMGMIDDGADMIDIGGESTRPGADPVSPEHQCRRIIPVIEALAGRIPISVDTRSAQVMRSAVAAGASVVNDVSALSADPEALEAVADLGCPVILMHSLRAPKTMQVAPRYRDVRLDIADYLDKRLAACAAQGISRDRIVVDPGIGFGQNDTHIALLLRDLAVLHGLGCAVMLGASRKSFIGRIDREGPASARLGGSVAAATLGLTRGVQFLRVHDVAQTRQAVAVWRHIEGR
jgi:dihydropteroate synthase